MEPWEKALTNHEKECEQRYLGIERQFGEVQTKLSSLDGKLTAFIWITGYMAVLLSAITLRVFMT